MKAHLTFVGDGHSLQFLMAAAADKGFASERYGSADTRFICFDIQVSAENLIGWIDGMPKAVVLTSPARPGTTRALHSLVIKKGDCINPTIIYQPELLRAEDAITRARDPEMIIVGTENGAQSYDALPADYVQYLMAFRCPVHLMTWEEAELAKAAINMALIAQVEYANKMAAIADKIGADWDRVARAIKSDKRIGQHAYLRPGDWKKSTHLMRDWNTLREIEEKGQ